MNPCRSGATVDGTSVGPGLEAGVGALWESLVGADDERAARLHAIPDAPQEPPLESRLEISEDEIAAEHEIEWSLGHRDAHVFFPEDNAFTQLVAQAKLTSERLESLFDPSLRQFAQARPCVSRTTGTLENARFSVARYDAERHGALGFRQPVAMEDGERIRLLARSAARAPARDERCTTDARGLDQHRQDLRAQHLEDPAIAVEARNRDPTRGVEDGPFARIPLEPFAISRDTVETELTRSPSDALADLRPHFPKAEPAKAEARQRPAQQLEAFSVASARHARL